jgi:hypothetical protein
MLIKCLYEVILFTITRGDESVIQANDPGFLLNETGGRLAVDALLAAGEFGPEGRPKLIDCALNERGFVLITRAHHATVVELCPLRVAPLAALAAIHHLKRTAAECVLLASLGDTWRRSPYELFTSVGAAVEKLKGVARAAGKRAAAEASVRSRSANDVSNRSPPAIRGIVMGGVSSPTHDRARRSPAAARVGSR